MHNVQRLFGCREKKTQIIFDRWPVSWILMRLIFCVCLFYRLGFAVFAHILWVLLDSVFTSWEPDTDLSRLRTAIYSTRERGKVEIKFNEIYNGNWSIYHDALMNVLQLYKVAPIYHLMFQWLGCLYQVLSPKLNI